MPERGRFEQRAKVREQHKENPNAGQLHSHILQVVVQDLYDAYQEYFRGGKQGEAPGHPCFKGHHRFDSFGLKAYGGGCGVAGCANAISRATPDAVHAGCTSWA